MKNLGSLSLQWQTTGGLLMELVYDENNGKICTGTLNRLYHIPMVRGPLNSNCGGY